MRLTDKEFIEKLTSMLEWDNEKDIPHEIKMSEWEIIRVLLKMIDSKSA